MKMQKVITEQPESGSLRKDTEVAKYFIDPKGEVWEWIGNCTGPKLAMFDKAGEQLVEDHGRGKVPKVRWIAQTGNPLPMENSDFIALLKNPKLAERWRTEETPRVSKEYLKKFYTIRPDESLRRRGCNVRVYVLAEELDAKNKGITCSWCGSICEFHGTPVKGSVADRALKARKAKKNVVVVEGRNKG